MSRVDSASGRRFNESKSSIVGVDGKVGDRVGAVGHGPVVSVGDVEMLVVGLSHDVSVTEPSVVRKVGCFNLH